MNGMEFHQQVRIIPYQEEWRKRFRQTKEVIIGILLAQNIECDVRHVGGTAVPGMCSKSIVDILVMVKAEDLLPAVRGLSEEFLCLGECGRVGRWFFSMGDNEHNAAYIHLTTPDNPVAKDQLAFLQLLQTSPALCKEYAALKMRLAEKYPWDRPGYRTEKGVFIERCLSGKLEEKT